MKLWSRFRRWCHLIRHTNKLFHAQAHYAQSVTMWPEKRFLGFKWYPKTIWIMCSCGKRW